jgi:hypothetical protein
MEFISRLINEVFKFAWNRLKGLSQYANVKLLGSIITMSKADKHSQFSVKLLRPTLPGGDPGWAFVVLPKEVSEKLPRRGRTTVEGKINGHSFTATLEPDGQLSHWLQLTKELQEAANVHLGDNVALEIEPVEAEPEPELPEDLVSALQLSPEALSIWQATTTIARVDWIHWITSAKQAKTRAKRINDACNMLSAGKKRVCCFDQSGYYSKAFSAPDCAE